MICSLHSRARASGYRHEISTPNRGQARRPRRPPRISTAPAIRFGKRTKPIDRAAGCACRAHQNATRFERIRSQVVHPIVQRKSAKENSGSVLNPVCKSINPRHDWLIRSDRASPGRLGRPGARPRGQRSRAPHLLLHSSISCGWHRDARWRIPAGRPFPTLRLGRRPVPHFALSEVSRAPRCSRIPQLSFCFPWNLTPP